MDAMKFSVEAMKASLEAMRASMEAMDASMDAFKNFHILLKIMQVALHF